MHFETQYIALGKSLIENGTWIDNPRTGVRCLTGRTVVFTYDCEKDNYPMITLRKSFWKSAASEIIGYLQGVTNAQEMADLGSPTWFANANENNSWLNNPHRKGENDMGFCYGAVGHDFGGIDQFKKVIDDLSNGVDDRGEIITYWKPDEFYRASLRPCMHSFQFTLIDGVLDMQATQRSADVPLGLVANAQQCYLLLSLVAHVTGHTAGMVTHVINNPHIYENQYDDFLKMMDREPIPCEPTLTIDGISTWDDIMNIKNLSGWSLDGYEHHDPIKFEMTA